MTHSNNGAAESNSAAATHTLGGHLHGRMQIALRVRDLDHQGHVFHATYATLFDEARTALLTRAYGGAPTFAVMRLEVDFHAELLLSDTPITITVAVADVGTSRIVTTESIVTPDGRHVASARCVSVWWDVSRHRKQSVPPDLKCALLQPGTLSMS